MSVSAAREACVGAVQLARMNSYAQQGGLLEGQQRQVMQNWLVVVVVVGVKSATQVFGLSGRVESSRVEPIKTRECRRVSRLRSDKGKKGSLWRKERLGAVGGLGPK